MLDFGYYNMDCMEGMGQFPDDYFDLAIVDPPYGINAPNMSMGSNKSRNGKGQYPGTSTAEKLRKGRLNQGAGKLKNRALNTMNCDWDFERPTKEYLDELFRVSTNWIIWGGNYFSDMLPPSRGIIVWDKMQPWENFSQAEIAYTSFDRPASIVRISNTGGINSEKKIHPTQKPIILYEWVLNRLAKNGDIILDTHVGSASSLIACRRTNHKFVGFEVDKQYYESSKQRLDAEMAQMNLFDYIGE